jgi:hypothetical protein
VVHGRRPLQHAGRSGRFTHYASALGMRRSVAFFLVLAVTMAVTLYIRGPARLYAALQANGAPAQGIIVDIECRKSTQFFYRFPAQGRSYTGSGTSIEQCSQFKPGASVPVVYLVTDPTQNFSGDPFRAYRNYMLATAIGSLLLSAGATIALHLRKRGHASRRNPVRGK